MCYINYGNLWEGVENNMHENDELLDYLAINTVVDYLCAQHNTDPLAAIAKLITAVAEYRVEKFVGDRDLYQASVCYADLPASGRRLVRERYFAYVKQTQHQQSNDDHCSTPGVES